MGLNIRTVIIGSIFFVAVVFGFTSRAEAASVYISPSSGSFSVGSTFKVTVRTNTDGQAVNSVEASVTYSGNTLEVVSVSAGGSFPMQTPGSPSHSGGNVFFSGGVPSPGYTGASGSVGVITFRAKAVGEGVVTVLSGKTLLNDGQGTNAFSGSSGARFTITPPPVAGPTVTSSTHPDPEAWYQAKEVIVSWNRPGNAYGFSFDFTQNSSTVPDDTLDTTVTTNKTYANVADGVWYFHIKARAQTGGFGSTVHFPIRIDTQSPKPFELQLTGQKDLSNIISSPTVEFTATDDGSGIAKYDAYVDGNLAAENIGSPYTYEKLTGGDHVLRIVAYDRAGNSVKADLSVIVSGPEAPVSEAHPIFKRTIQVPVLILIGMNALIILLLIIIIILLWRRKKEKPENVDLAQIQKEMNDGINALKELINAELSAIRTVDRDRVSQVRSKIGKSISKTMHELDKEMAPLKQKRKKST